MASQTEFSDIIEQLSVHEATVTAELDQVATRARQLGERLDQIQSALAALRDQKSNPKPSRGSGNAKMKKRVSAALVQEFATTVLSKNDRLTFDQLLDGVKSEMLARGLSRVGAKSLLTEAITKPPFTINPDQTISAT